MPKALDPTCPQAALQQAPQLANHTAQEHIRQPQPQDAVGRVQAISSLVDGSGSVVQLNDKGLLAPMRVRLNFHEA